MKLQHRESQKTWHCLAKAFWQDERGQSTTEYILILSVVVMIVMKFKNMFLTRMEGAVNTLGGSIDDAMKETN